MGKGYVRKKPRSVWDTLSFEEHPEVHAFIADRPDGAAFHEIGAAMGVTRQRAQQIFLRALSKLRDYFGVTVIEEEYEERIERLPSLEELTELELEQELDALDELDAARTEAA